MATVQELIESRSIGSDGETRTGVRVFRVDMPPDAVILTPPPGLPRPIFDRWPADEELVCTRLDAEYWRNSVNESIVRATYSTDDSGRYSLNPLRPDFHSWSISYKNVVEEIPYWVRDDTAYRYVDINGVQQFLATYEIKAEKHIESRKIITRRVVLQDLSYEQIEAIGNQNGKLHKINNLWYRFHVGDIEEQAKRRWATMYQWEYDPGTPDFFKPANWSNFPPGAGTLYMFPFNQVTRVPNMYTGREFCRPPFHVFAVLPSRFSPGPPPAYEPPTINNVVCPYEIDAEGWRVLPGVQL